MPQGDGTGPPRGSAAEAAEWEATAQGLARAEIASVPVAGKKYPISRESPVLI